MKEIIKAFIAKILLIKGLNPKRREPGDGSDGYCDCIGLIIGAIRRMGYKWTGIHGTNWAARKEFVQLKKINSVSDLSEGDVVLKGRSQANSKWSLPTRYRKGGAYYNGDLTDYYHAGAVTKTNPLNITHMSDKMTVDTKLGNWGYYGTLKILANAAKNKEPDPQPINTPSEGSIAVVTAPSGSTVNMRKAPRLSGALIIRIPIGKTVQIVTPGEEWAYVSYGKYKGYMMAKYLDIVGDGKGNY